MLKSDKLLVNTTLYSTSNASRNISFIETVRGRVGYLVQPNLLAYGTAGFAYGGTSLRYNGYQTVAEPPTTEYGPGASSHSQVNVGWTAGGGLEWMLSGNWSVKAEYLYYDLGTTSLFGGYNVRAWTGASSLAGVPVGSPIMIRDTTASTHFNGSIARAGVNYHFNLGSAPVVAKF